MILKYSVGIDISYKTFRACICTIDSKQAIKIRASRKFDNTLSGFKHFLYWSTKYHKDKDLPMHFCLEATGVYHENLAHYLHKNKKRISIVLANLSNKYLASLGQKTKNDPIDAMGLAQMGAERQLSKWDPPAEFYAELRSLTRFYQNLQEQKTVYSNQLHALEVKAFKSKLVINQLKSMIKKLDSQLGKITQAIQNHLNQKEEVRKKVDQICAIKGVAELTVAVVVGETYGFELFRNAKQLISYSGYDVIENQSGKRTGKTKISKKGNSRIRRAMFLPAFNVVRYKEDVFSNLFNRTLSKHNIKMKSYVAVQKKILTTIYALWRKDEAFNPNYYKIKINEEQNKIASPREKLQQVHLC